MRSYHHFSGADLMVDCNTVVEAIIYSDPGGDNPFFTSLAAADGGDIDT